MTRYRSFPRGRRPWSLRPRQRIAQWPPERIHSPVARNLSRPMTVATPPENLRSTGASTSSRVDRGGFGSQCWRGARTDECLTAMKKGAAVHPRQVEGLEERNDVVGLLLPDRAQGVLRVVERMSRVALSMPDEVQRGWHETPTRPPLVPGCHHVERKPRHSLSSASTTSHR